MKLVLMSVVLSGIALATGVSVGVWRPRIDFASSCSPAMVTLLSASCGDGLRHWTTSPLPADVVSSPEVAGVAVSTPEARPKATAVEAVSAPAGRPQKPGARHVRGKSARLNAPLEIEALAVAQRVK